MIPYETSLKFMIGGYAVMFSILVIYFVSLWVRWRNLIREWQALQEEQEN
ncbi:MAG: hypothetical protein N2049_12035 [Anaerolineales bacterium]|nr:hypothetical protein [Anaerolineales bacterium]MCX7609929.1 hypothetical protein [Anaerolineales bacterium]MDW8227641.1 hypothetical protein [Anaerolineales bacterium]